jgi:hypothetical protein
LGPWSLVALLLGFIPPRSGFCLLCADRHDVVFGQLHLALLHIFMHAYRCSLLCLLSADSLSRRPSYHSSERMASAGTEPVGMADVNTTLPPPPDTNPTQHAPSRLRDKSDARCGSSPGRWKERYTPARPDPWVQRKIAVGYVKTTVTLAHTRSILIALVIWSFYVVVGRIGAPAIQRKSAASWSRATGGGFTGIEEEPADSSAGTMVGYVVLWLLFAWSYLKVSQ